MSIAATSPSLPEPDAVLAAGLDQLRDLLPPDWKVERQAPPSDMTYGAGRVDAAVSVQVGSSGLYATIVVEARRQLAPRDVEDVARDRLTLMRAPSRWSTFLVIAPWLSPRTRALLADRGIDYLDLTGNALLRMARPAVMIRTVGAAGDPAPAPRSATSLRGAAAGRIVRYLADVRPPYTATAIASATGVSVAQVSRLLTALDREALVERGTRGLVVGADWAGLLRRRAEVYDLFRANRARGYVATAGPRDMLDRLPALPEAYRALTGSFAAVVRAPIASPGQLALYVDDADATAAALDLLPADRGADVVLLRPYDPAVLERAERSGGVVTVAPSQLALDCLAGNGRMPAEGEALLAWMAAHEDEWRRPGADVVPPR